LKSTVSDQIVDEIKRRIIEIANPRRIIVFGSAGRGEMRPSSDLDVLVVMPPGVHRRATAWSIYRNLIGAGMAVNIIVVTEQDIERYKNHIGMVIKPALEQGTLIYAR
jgi:predicted nucleotidyltransferase